MQIKNIESNGTVNIEEHVVQLQAKTQHSHGIGFVVIHFDPIGLIHIAMSQSVPIAGKTL